MRLGVLSSPPAPEADVNGRGYALSRSGSLLARGTILPLPTPQKEPLEQVAVPRGYPTSTIYVDDSGTRASGSRCFVLGAGKIRAHGALMREVHHIRDAHSFEGEFKFHQITEGTRGIYYEVIDAIEASDLHVAACIVDASIFDPFSAGQPTWRVHATVLGQLLIGCINRVELVSVLMDTISTPRSIALDDVVRGEVNHRLKSTAVVSAACLDSRTCDGLQIADLIAGAVALEHRRSVGLEGNYHSPKSKVADRLKAALGTDFRPGRSDRVNVQTYSGRRRRAPTKSAGKVAKPTARRP